MRRRILFIAIVIAISLVVTRAQAATATLWTEFIQWSGEPGPRPYDKGLKLFLSSDADILSISHVRVVFPNGGSLFQIAAPLGSNVEPPHPAFIAAFPDLAFDSWLSTPGATSRQGTDLPGDGTGEWFDVIDNGPQTNFQWGMLTATAPIDAAFTFTGRINLAGTSGPVIQPFRIDGQTGEVTIPEPATLGPAGAAGVILQLAMRRRRGRRSGSFASAVKGGGWRAK